MVWILMSSIMMALAGLITYLYFYKNGQFENTEDIKYQMFRQEHEDNNQGK